MLFSETRPAYGGRTGALSDRIKAYFLFFLLYSIIGWCYEVFLEVVVYRWGFTNRGFLFGPYCPIYGFGALAFLFCFGGLMRKKDSLALTIVKPLLIFVGCMVVATLIELAASYLMEWVTGSWPWQTYADYKYNFQARIALSPSIRFGLGGVVFLYVLQPLFERVVYALSPRVLDLCFFSLLFVFLLDLFVRVAGLLLA